MELRHYQKEAVQWMAERKAGLLADDMGLGKTVTTASALKVPALIVCPAGVKAVWRDTLATWRSALRVHVLEGLDAKPDFANHDVVIVNYDILPPVDVLICSHCKCSRSRKQPGGYICQWCKCPWFPTQDIRHKADIARDWTGIPSLEFLVADEAHNLSNFKAKRTQSFRALTWIAKKKFLLTGTPMRNAPPDLWTVLQCIGLGAQVFGSWQGLIMAFSGRQSKFGAWEWKEPNAYVAEHLKKVMLRRTKEEVLTELPGYTDKVIPVELPKIISKQHEALAEQCGVDDDLLVDLTKMPAEVGKLAELRALTARAKIGAALEIVESYEANGEPLVVFCNHSEPVQKLAKRDGWALIDGTVSAPVRAKAVEDFQAGRLKGLACNTRAGGVGITLTFASHALFIDESWSPSENMQARDRIRRMGQRNHCVYLHMVAETRLEKAVWNALSKKLALTQGAGI